MTINATKTVREIAVEMPDATRIFEKLKIDYCCGGGKTLEEACLTSGTKLDDVISLLDKAETEQRKNSDDIDFQSMSLNELITHILDTHHVFTREEIQRLTGLMQKVCSVHGENHPELFELQNYTRLLFNDLEPHLFKEESILFPYIVRLEMSAQKNLFAPFPPFGTIANPVRMMSMEHDNAGDLLKKMREITSDYKVPADVCISYQTLYSALEIFERDLHQHIHLENNILFPRAIKLEQEVFG